MKYRNFLFICIIIFVNILTFVAPEKLNIYFTGDDYNYLTEMYSPLREEGFWRGLFYRPFAHYYFNYVFKLFRLNPVGYHLTNIFIHILNSVLVFWLVLILTKNSLTSLIAGLIFSIHYINTATTFYLGRVDVIAVTGIYLLSFIFFVKFISYKKVRYYFLTLILFLGGLYINESIITLPIVLLICDILFTQKKGENLKKIILRNLPFQFLNGAYLFMYIFIFPSYIRADMRFKVFFSDFYIKVINLATYLKLLFIPFDFQNSSIAFWHPYNHSFWISIFILITLFVIFILVKKTNYRLGLAWLFVSTIPFLQHPDAPYLKEHYLYISLIGTSIIFSLIIQDGFRRLKRLEGSFTAILKFIFVAGLLLSFYFSSLSRISAHIKVGRIVKDVQQNILRDLPKDIKNSILYFANFPRWTDRIHSFPTYPVILLTFPDVEQNRVFSCSGNLHNQTVRDFLEYNSNFYSNYCPAGRAFFENNKNLLYCFNKYFFYYNNGKIYNLTEEFFSEHNIVFKIRTHSDIQSISVVGDFNNWDKDTNPLTFSDEGIWTATLSLNPGRYRYKFVVDDKEWLPNPHSKYYENDPIYGKSSILLVKDAISSLILE